MKNRWCSAIAFLAVILSVSQIVIGMGRKESGSLKDKKELALSSDVDGVVIHCHIKNVAERNVSLHVLPVVDTEVELYSEEGWNGLKPAILFDVRISKKDIFLLKPNEVHSFDLKFSKDFFVWPSPSEYEARIVYSNGLEKIDGINVWTGKIESNTIQLKFADVSEIN